MNFGLIWIWSQILFIIIVSATLIKADFTKDFQLFIQQNFGNETEKNLTRSDLGGGGSFGGKLTETKKKEKV